MIANGGGIDKKIKSEYSIIGISDFIFCWEIALYETRGGAAFLLRGDINIRRHPEFISNCRT